MRKSLRLLAKKLVYLYVFFSFLAQSVDFRLFYSYDTDMIRIRVIGIIVCD